MTETHLELPIGVNGQKLETSKRMTRRKTFRHLSTKFCFFCFGFLFGLVLATALLAAFQHQSRESRSLQPFDRHLVSIGTTRVTTHQSTRETTPETTTFSFNQKTATNLTEDVFEDVFVLNATSIPSNERTVEDFETILMTTSSSIQTTSSSPIGTTYSSSIETTSSSPIETTSSAAIETTSSASIGNTSSASIGTTSSASIGTTSSASIVNTSSASIGNTSSASIETTTHLNEEVMKTTTFETKETTLSSNESEATTRVFPRDLTRALTMSPELNITEMSPLLAEVTSLAANESDKTAVCLSSEFLCEKENICLDFDYRCDGRVDCRQTGSDESDCNVTCHNNFRCGNFCISRHNYCDGIWDCPLGEDESCHVTECPIKGEFLCKDKRKCIKGKEACDRVSHCRDHSDEIGCLARAECQKSSASFFCADSDLCIDRALTCDQVRDCPDGSDEAMCQTRESCSGFLCDNNECIDSGKRCDGIAHCFDQSDELLCVTRDSNNTVLVFIENDWRPLCVDEDLTEDQLNTFCQSFGEYKVQEWNLKKVKPLKQFWSLMNRTLTGDCPQNTTLQLSCSSRECGKSDTLIEPLLIVDETGKECTAHVVAPHWLLMSAQCQQKLSENISSLRIFSSKTEIQIEIQKTYKHFRHSLFRSVRIPDFDLCLIRTRQTVPLQEVCLPPHAIDPAITCFASEETNFEVIESAVCNSSQHLAGSLTSRHFCAQKTLNQSHCLKRGTPLMCLSSDSRWYVAGFLSFQYGCSPEAQFNGYSYLTHPTVFSNVFSVKNWIKKMIGIQENDSIRDPKDFYDVITDEENSNQTTIAFNETENRSEITEQMFSELKMNTTLSPLLEQNSTFN